MASIARDLWAAQVREKGGVPNVRIPDGMPDAGALAARYPPPQPAGPYTKGGYRWEPAPLNVRMADGAEDAKLAAQRIAGKAVDARDAIVQATGIDNGALGVLSKVLGIPRPLVLVLALLLAWSMLQGAGLVPPLSRVVKG